ncbi:MAG: OmpA family protein [Deltaproteobacteria bacterium]|nr:OmpA family protein [Deltaproteobacteria bacterium]
MNKLFVATSALGLLAATLAGCGHSEEEWQVQLGRLRTELTRSDARQKELGEVRQQLAEARNRVAELEQQLVSMGLAVDTKDKPIEDMTEGVAEVRKALDSYKARQRLLEIVKARLVALRTKLEELSKLGVRAGIRKNRMVITLPGDALFDSGKAELKADGKAMLLKLASIIQTDPSLTTREFQARSHTDNKPPVGPGTPDNLGLTLIRAKQVVVFLTTPTVPVAKRGERPPEPGAGLNPQRWSAAGYGDVDPVFPNDSPEGMQRNRRIELVILPSLEEMLDLRSLADFGG